MQTNERRTQLKKAIAAIEGGAQEYQLGSKRIRRADLSTLYEEQRRQDMEELNMSGGRTTVAVFDRR